MAEKKPGPVTETIILTKAPDPTRSKTRLAPLPPPLRQQISKAMIEDTLVYALAWSKGLVTVACDPGTSHPFFQELAKNHPIALCNQSQGDLGDRLTQLLLNPPGGGRNVVFLGSDCPHMPENIFKNALLALNTYDAVIAPSSDGGYVLIGLTPQATPLLKGIPWSTSAVSQTTQKRAIEAGLSLKILPPSFDIDTPQDLHQLMETCPKEAAQFTRAVLEKFDSQGGVIYVGHNKGVRLRVEK